VNAIQPAKALLIAAVIGLGLSGGFAAAAFLPGGNAPAAVSQIWDQTVGQMFGNVLGEKGSYFTAAATYIGITEAQLRTELGTDKSLADVAIAHGKTRDGLIAALRTSRRSSTRRASAPDRTRRTATAPDRASAADPATET